MKDIRPAIRQLLLNDATVSSLVGGSRVFPGRLPQGQRQPSIVYNRITETSNVDMTGWQEFGNAHIQVDAWADTTDSAAVLADASFDVLRAYKGTVSYGSNSPQSSVDISGIFLITGRENYDNESQLYRMSRDYEVWFYQR